MAKEKKTSYSYPSFFGSHKSMINEAKTAELTDDSLVVLTDEHGDYITEKNRLDNGESDRNRWASSRLNKLFDKKVDEGNQ